MFPALYIAVCMLLLALIVVPLGAYMARVYNGEKIWLETPLGWLERLIYSICAIDRDKEMGWFHYAISVLSLGLLGFLSLFLIFSMQHLLPFNPEGFDGLSPDLAFNAAISFAANTNWQSYAGEGTLSYFSQMVGITVQNFVSAATGMAVAVAMIRGLTRHQTETLGNPFVDIVRGILYILLPIAFVVAVFFVSQGMIQNMNSYTHFTSIFNGQDMVIAQGPAASQISIKMLGSNGGGFFNVNGAHPFTNPTPLTNTVQIIYMLLLPASMLYMFGILAKDVRQCLAIIASILIIFTPLVYLVEWQEMAGNPWIPSALIDNSAGNMEGKEVRFGVTSSAFWTAATTATSSGSVNSMLDSYMPLSGLIPLMLIQFQVLFGGVGTGVYGMLMFVLLTVFMAGLMVGRTPEFLGKKLGPFEIKMASIVMVMPGALMLSGTAIAMALDAGRAGVFNGGSHAFTEILYAFASASNNNGSAYGGINANTPFYNTALGICIFLGRYWVIIPVLAIAGGMGERRRVPASSGTLPTHTPLFSIMLCFVILLNLLTYMPSIALGPIAEHIHLSRIVGGGL